MNAAWVKSLLPIAGRLTKFARQMVVVCALVVLAGVFLLADITMRAGIVSSLFFISHTHRDVATQQSIHRD